MSKPKHALRGARLPQTEAVSPHLIRLGMTYPHFLYILYTLTPVRADEELPTLAVDGHYLYVNEEFWASLPKNQKMSVLVHEALHITLGHCTRRGLRDPMLWNIAADHVVNLLILEMDLRAIDDWVCDAQYRGMSTEEVYNILVQKVEDQKQQAQQGQGAPGEGEPGEGNDYGHEAAAGAAGASQAWCDKWQDVRDSAATEGERMDDDRKRMEAVNAAMQHADPGKLPGHLRSMVDLLSQPAEEPWFNHLHRFMQSLSRTEFSWEKGNRRKMCAYGMMAPDLFSERLESVVVAIDTSGSCFSKASQAGFAAQVKVILDETRPKKVHVLYFDTRVARHDELDESPTEFESLPEGGGGTDFSDIFDTIEEEGIAPEVTVILTDCLGGYPPNEPDYPVIWASVLSQKEVNGYFPPFGEFLHLKPTS